MKEILIIFTFFVSIAFSQLPIPISQEGSTTFSRDTLCINYKFNINDSIYYRVEAYDSIVRNYDDILIRKRYEKHLIVVDSISFVGDYHLAHTMIEYIALESKGEIKDVSRTESSWLDQTVHYTIDKFGDRKSYKIEDPSKINISPGGQFTPYLFFDLATDCKVSGTKWVSLKTIELPENAIPSPTYKHSTLFQMSEPIDTLDEVCARIELTRTGEGNYQAQRGDKTFSVDTKTNGFGALDISFEKQIPVHFFMSNEQKLSISMGDGTTIPGFQYTKAYFTLDELKRNESEE